MEHALLPIFTDCGLWVRESRFIQNNLTFASTLTKIICNVIILFQNAQAISNEFLLLSPTRKLAGRTLFITGASRGIGKAIALKAAKDGANIVIAAKTAEAHPKLPGTIYTAAEESKYVHYLGFKGRKGKLKEEIEYSSNHA